LSRNCTLPAHVPSGSCRGQSRLQFYLGEAEKDAGAGVVGSGKGPQCEGGKGAVGRGKRQLTGAPREAGREEQACGGRFGPD